MGHFTRCDVIYLPQLGFQLCHYTTIAPLHPLSDSAVNLFLIQISSRFLSFHKLTNSNKVGPS